jgi:hypothetical protein
VFLGKFLISSARRLGSSSMLATGKATSNAEKIQSVARGANE